MGAPAAPQLLKQNRAERTIIALTLALAALLLFARLGRNALWDDEAGTALTAKSILRNGDSLMFVDDHNILAYRQGSELQGVKLRYVPPLSSYLLAGVFYVLEPSAWSARLPFALFGFGTIAWLMCWARASRASLTFLALLGAGLVTHVSLLLYSRQCRYYSVAILLSVVAARLYLCWDGRRRTLLTLCGVSILLLATNYLSYFALYACLGVDYCLQRHSLRRLGAREWIWLLGPQLIAGLVLVSIWNPFIRAPGVPPQNTVLEKLILLSRQWPEINGYEFVSFGILLLAVIVAVQREDEPLCRALIALVVYVAAVTALSPQRVAQTSDAAMRYVLPIIPLGLFIAVRTIVLLARGRALLAAALGVIAFGTNLLHGGPWAWNGFRSTIIDYTRELLAPPGEPYTPAARWIREHVPAGGSVWCVPDHTTYPLMFHAPQATYAWQLPYPPAAQFQGLPPVHFNGLEPPHYIIVFGPFMPHVLRKIAPWEPYGIRYELEAVLDCYWQDVHRPELRLHHFYPVQTYDRRGEAIYVLKLHRS